jgi:hypothetical protein
MSNVMTPEFRVSFPAVFKPSRPKGAPADQEAKYSLTMLFDRDADLSALKKAAEAAAKEKWGDDIPKGLRTPFRDQGEKEFDGYEEGALFVIATSKQKPGLVDAQVNDIIDESEFYAGCYARATIRAFAYGGKGTSFKPGVSFGLQNVQKLRDGDPLGGRTRARDDFSAVETDAGEDSDGLFD